MPIDAGRILGWTIPPVEQSWTERDCMLYALALGFGQDPLDEQALRYVVEPGPRVVPTMAGILGYPGLWLAAGPLGIDAGQLLHGEERIELHRPLPAQGRVVGVNRAAAVVDKGRGRGALVVTQRVLHDASGGTPLATLLHTAVARADGGFARDAADAVQGAPPPPLPSVPDRSPDMVVDLATRPEAALLYRLCGDRTPLHADPAAAREAGFTRPILHGMATFGIAARALLGACCDWDASRLTGIAGRFTAAVYPGETLRTEIWPGGDGIAFRVSVPTRACVVLDRGRARIGGPATPNGQG